MYCRCFCPNNRTKESQNNKRGELTIQSGKEWWIGFSLKVWTLINTVDIELRVILFTSSILLYNNRV